MFLPFDVLQNSSFQMNPKIMLFLKTSFVLMLVFGVLVAVVFPLLIAKPASSKFELICETKSDPGNIPVVKFRSEKTGLHIIFAKVDGPIVQGYFTIPTEAKSDDGLPHTLEHLVFLGSEDYPYKGVLDLLANRCLATGTNAWTAIDHTAYTVKTAGKEGFLNLFPIFMDHLLFPTLTDAGFTTEVYHVTGKGEDAGVVYSEMQARENTGSSRTYLELLREMYPSPSGYRYETGGIMDNLRNLTNEKIRNYHKAMYRPENMYIVITGQVEHSEVFKAVEKIEQKIINKGEKSDFQKPWQDPVSPLNESVDREVVYPSAAEDTGMVRVAWRGPSTVTDVQEYQSIEVLLKYLTDVSVSPLPKVFVEVDDPLASQVYGNMLEYSLSSIIITFSGVPKEKIGDVSPLLKDTLKQIVDGDIPIDLKVMENTLTNLILNQKSLLEVSPHYSFAEKIIQDALYGNQCGYIDKLISKKLWFEKLISKPASYWQGLIKKYMISSPSVVIRGVPSMAESKRLQEEQKKRKEERKERLGEDGLKKLAEEVAQAKQINEIPPPDWMLQSVPVPSTTNIQFHSLNVFTNIMNHNSGNIPSTDPTLFNLKSVPVKIQVDDVKSNFVQLIAILDTRSLTPDERFYLTLIMELILESPLMKDGEEIPFDKVIKDLNADTLSAKRMKGILLNHSMFSFGTFMQNIGINLKVKPEKYEEGVQWISDVLFKLVFKPKRVSVKISKLLNSIGEYKRSGPHILSAIFRDAIYVNDANINKVNPLRQEIFLKQVNKDLKSNETQVISELENIYKKLTNLDRITIHMAANLEELAKSKNITKPWVKFSPSGSEATSLDWDVIRDSDQRKPLTDEKGITGYIFGLESLESSYMYQTTESVSDFSHEDLPALLTVGSYLTQMEGPMWKQIRGRGLSYNYKITQTSSSGILTLQLRKTAQLIGAYKEALNIINSYLNGTEKWNQILFESARSSLSYQIVGREADISDVVQQSILSYYRKVSHDYNKSFLRALDNVKLEDLDRVAQKYLRPMITPSLSQTGIVCPSSKVEEIKTEFNKLGHNLKEITDLEDSSLAKL